MADTRALRPGVSVVIPVKDRARLLTQTLRSVREQTRSADEVIVVDDGSVDDSAAVARAAGATVAANERPGQGPGRVRNVGLQQVRTELVCPLDSDDLLLPRALEALEEALARAPEAPFAFGRALTAFREEGGWRPEGILAPLDDDLDDLLCSLFARNFVPSCALLARTAAVLDVGGYPENPELITNAEDHRLWIELASRAPPVHVAEVVSLYRRHSGNLQDPVRGRAATKAITAMAAEDERLEACRPERLGVQLVDILASARLRRPREAGRAVWDMLVREPKRGRILRAALRHLRGRRGAAREAARLWSADEGLRRLLASYE